MQYNKCHEQRNKTARGERMIQGRRRDTHRLSGKPLRRFETREWEMPCKVLEGKGEKVPTSQMGVNWVKEETHGVRRNSGHLRERWGQLPGPPHCCGKPPDVLRSRVRLSDPHLKRWLWCSAKRELQQIREEGGRPIRKQQVFRKRWRFRSGVGWVEVVRVLFLF